MLKDDVKVIHPFQISIVGFSNTGKTTLIEKLLKELSQNHCIGFLKRDSHGFEIDKEGKDTYRIREAGASSVYIEDETRAAQYGDRVTYISETMSQCDIVIQEGWKYSDQPKLVMVGEEKHIIDDIKSGKIKNVLATISAQRNPELNEYPHFYRNDIDGIIEFIEENILQEAYATPVNGLVLTGGFSKRMQEDKSQIDYHGKKQVERCYELLSEVCLQTLVSCRPEQSFDLPTIEDTYLNKGPMGGILSALDKDPEAAWLVLACDLPLVDIDTLENLITERNPFKMATTYVNSEGLPEPLCTIYEPHSSQTLLRFMSYGVKCPRKVLIHSNVKTLSLNGSDALRNANTPEEREALKEIITNKK